VTFAVGQNAVNTLLGGQHIPINGSYWTNSATGLSQSLPISGTGQPLAVSTTTTGTNSISKAVPVVIQP
jgi:hypothetical protein